MSVTVACTHVGVALLISNDYAGSGDYSLEFTHSDSDKVKQLFESDDFMYKVYQQKNVSKIDFISWCKRIAEYNYPETCKRILVYFSGHGTEGVIELQDGETVPIEDVISHFKPNIANNDSLASMVKLFFIDACRGTKNEAEAISKAVEDRRVSNEANIVIAFASPQSFKCFGYTDGSRWTNCLIEALQRSKVEDSLYDVVTAINRMMSVARDGVHQTPEFQCRGLTDVVYFKREAKERRKQQASIIEHPKSVKVMTGESAKFFCAVDRGREDFNDVQWQIKNDKGAYVCVPDQGRYTFETIIEYNILKSLLTVSGISIRDFGDCYRCQPTADVVSNIASIQATGCFDPTQKVDILPGGNDPETIPTFLYRTCDKVPNVDALYWKTSIDSDTWKSITYKKYWNLIYKVAKSFIKLGLKLHHAVGILGSNSVEWFASSMGAVFAGGLSTGIYITNNQEECQYILEDCKANIVVVENQELLDRIFEIRDKLSHLKAIVQYKGELLNDYPKTFVYTWPQFLKEGEDVKNSEIDTIIYNQTPNQCAVLVYTSGTTGNPKGVMLSHDNLTWTTKALIGTLQEKSKMKMEFAGKERSVSYLPLAHISGMVADMFLPVFIQSSVYFAQPDCIKKGTFIKTLCAVKPTFFFGVPRLWEAIKDTIEEQLEGGNALASVMTKIAKHFAQQKYKKHFDGRISFADWILAALSKPFAIATLKKYKEHLGLIDCKHIVVGADSMPCELLFFFLNLDIPVLELYGTTECTGIQALNVLSKPGGEWRIGSCGKSIDGVNMKVDKLNEHDYREVLLHGRHVFMGYCNMEKETKEVFREERWFCSGDIGEITVPHGFLYITGRAKEIITLFGGKQVFPVGIEGYIKSEVPFLSNVMLTGEGENFLTCLVTLKCAVDRNTREPTNILHAQVKNLGSKCETISEVVETREKVVYEEIKKGIDRYNDDLMSNCTKSEKYFDQVFQVKKFEILKTDFTIEGGELGPTLKLRRSKVMKKYKNDIEMMYQRDSMY